MIQVKIIDTVEELGMAAGALASSLIQTSIREKGKAHIILATGSSQFATLHYLVEDLSIDWSKVVLFHLDEYLGIPETNRASFRRYLQDRFIHLVPGLNAVHLIQGEAEPVAECTRLGALIQKHPIDVALVGIGENGHLAFNDPPADFDTEEPYIIVTLDEACRKQQLGEGWFDSMDLVPEKAISMSIRQIMKSKHIICSVPDARKAIAVRNCLQGEVNNLFPASILQRHTDCHVFLDKAAASLLQ